MKKTVLHYSTLMLLIIYGCSKSDTPTTPSNCAWNSEFLQGKTFLLTGIDSFALLSHGANQDSLMNVLKLTIAFDNGKTIIGSAPDVTLAYEYAFMIIFKSSYNQYTTSSSSLGNSLQLTNASGNIKTYSDIISDCNSFRCKTNFEYEYLIKNPTPKSPGQPNYADSILAYRFVTSYVTLKKQ